MGAIAGHLCAVETIPDLAATGQNNSHMSARTLRKLWLTEGDVQRQKIHSQDK